MACRRSAYWAAMLASWKGASSLSAIAVSEAFYSVVARSWGVAASPPFCEAPAQGEAIDQLRRAKVDGLIVIGGNGSQCGTLALHEQGFPAVGVASTIDNDLAETEMTIGVDTALNTAVGYIDRLKDTASSHHRAFIVETMGRASGYLALIVALATGAEVALVPRPR